MLKVATEQPGRVVRLNIHDRIMGFTIFCTVLLCIANLYQEQMWGLLTYIIAPLFSVVGSVMHMLAYKKFNSFKWAYLGSAYFLSLFSLIAYFVYSTGGKADSLETAGHMHVITFPILHLFISVALFIFISVPAVIKRVLSN